MLSGRGLSDEPITRPEESYQLCCVVVCDLETSRMGAPYIYDISHLRVNRSSPKLSLVQMVNFSLRKVCIIQSFVNLGLREDFFRNIIYLDHPLYCGPGSVVRITTGYGLDVRGSNPGGGRFFPHLSRPPLGPTEPPVQ